VFKIISNLDRPVEDEGITAGAWTHRTSVGKREECLFELQPRAHTTLAAEQETGEGAQAPNQEVGARSTLTPPTLIPMDPNKA